MGGYRDEQADGLLLGGILPEVREGDKGSVAAGRPDRDWLAKTEYGLLALNDRLLDWYGLAALVLLWETAPRLGWIDIQFFPPPSAIVRVGWELAASGELASHVAASLWRTFQGLAAAVVAAISIGFVLGGGFPRLTNFLRPLLKLLGQINAFSLFPLFVLFFGIGELAKFSIIFWSCLWPILFTTIAGVQGVEPLLVKSARSMGSGRLTLFARVLLPAALPSIFSGVRIGASVAFLMLIAAEMIGASQGLGWLVHNAQVNSLIPRLFLAAVLIALFSMSLNYGIRWLEGRVIRGKEEVSAA